MIKNQKYIYEIPRIDFLNHEKMYNHLMYLYDLLMHNKYIIPNIISTPTSIKIIYKNNPITEIEFIHMPILITLENFSVGIGVNVNNNNTINDRYFKFFFSGLQGSHNINCIIHEPEKQKLKKFLKQLLKYDYIMSEFSNKIWRLIQEDILSNTVSGFDSDALLNISADNVLAVINKKLYNPEIHISYNEFKNVINKIRKMGNYTIYFDKFALKYMKNSYRFIFNNMYLSDFTICKILGYLGFTIENIKNQIDKYILSSVLN